MDHVKIQESWVAYSTGFVVGWLARDDQAGTLAAIQADRRSEPAEAIAIVMRAVMPSADVIRAIARVPCHLDLVDWGHVARMCDTLESIRGSET